MQKPPPSVSTLLRDILFTFLESKERVQRDKQELHALELRYGDSVAEVLEARISDDTISKRDRNHWRRLLKRLRK